MTNRLTNTSSINAGIEQRQRERVPSALARHHAAEGLEIGARQLAREGYSLEAIADALQIDAMAVRRLIGAQQP